MPDYEETRKHMRLVGLKPSWSNAVIVAEALSRGIEVSARSNGTIVVLRHQRRTHRWRWGYNTLNQPLARTATMYKDVTSRLIAYRGINSPENAVFVRGEEERAWAWAEAFDSVVIKPNDGSRGRNVYVGIQDWDRFAELFRRVAGSHGKVLVEKAYSGTEHRCLVVDGTLVAATRRRPASILGDGISTIRQLVAEKNKRRGPIHRPIRLGTIEIEQLNRQGLDPDAVPPDQQRVYLRLTSNLHTGGDAIDASDAIEDRERAAIEEASRAFPGLRIAGFDALLPRVAGDSELCVLEVNSSPMISMHHFPWEGRPRNVAGAVLGAMFPATEASAAVTA